MRLQKPTPSCESRAGEKGAALITAVLLSLFLLAAGGTLILTTTMTGMTARDSTAEMQAYYAAEAGVSRILEVLRGNVEASDVNTRATFKNVRCSPNLWTATSGSYVNVAGDGSTRFRLIQLSDPDNAAPDCGDALYNPERLRVLVAGVGPNGSNKQMEIVV